MHKVQVGQFFFEPRDSNKLGSGSFATVYKGFSNDKRETVAVKVIDYDTRNELEKRYLSQEVRLMKTIAHPNVLMLRESKVRITYTTVYSPTRKLELKSFSCWRSVHTQSLLTSLVLWRG
jgi:serine/threonine protein kinase